MEPLSGSVPPRFSAHDRARGRAYAALADWSVRETISQARLRGGTPRVVERNAAVGGVP